MTLPPPLVVTIAQLRQLLPKLEGVIVVGLDLTEEPIDWAATKVRGALFLGCELPPNAAADVLGAGGVLLSELPGRRPFTPYRTELYSRQELAKPAPDSPHRSLDERIAGYYHRTVAGGSLHFVEALAQGIHDACIDSAVDRFRKAGGGHAGRIVGIMGGHDTPRTDHIYEEVVRAAFQLTRAGYRVATGGGLGIMEAGNLGAWLAGAADDDRITDALRIIRRGPGWSRKNRAAFLDAAEAVIKRWPRGAQSLGMATWVYRDEPVSQFATDIAKYFNNHIRENGLLSLATSGVIYAPGGAGTSQEIFTDAAQNSYRIFDVASPMILLGRRNYMDAEAALTAALQAQAVGAKDAWDDRLAVVDRAADAVQFIREHDPVKASGVTPEAGDRARERKRR